MVHQLTRKIMAINKSIELENGVTTSHHIFSMEVDNVGDKMKIIWSKFVSAEKFNAGKTSIEQTNFMVKFVNVPAGIKTKLADVLADIEAYALANIADFSGGIRVKDDGTPL